MILKAKFSMSFILLLFVPHFFHELKISDLKETAQLCLLLLYLLLLFTLTTLLLVINDKNIYSALEITILDWDVDHPDYFSCGNVLLSYIVFFPPLDILQFQSRYYKMGKKRWHCTNTIRSWSNLQWVQNSNAISHKMGILDFGINWQLYSLASKSFFRFSQMNLLVLTAYWQNAFSGQISSYIFFLF